MTYCSANGASDPKRTFNGAVDAAVTREWR
jgi:hypothetical protein